MGETKPTPPFLHQRLALGNAAGESGLMSDIPQVSQNNDKRIKPHSYIKKPNDDHYFFY